MGPLDPETYPAEGLIDTHNRLMAMVEKIGPDQVGMPIMCAIATVKVALLAFGDAQSPETMRAFERGQEKLAAGDAMVEVGAACTAAAMVLHARLVGIQPRTLSVQRAGEMATELNKLGGQITKAGYRMAEVAGHEGQGNAALPLKSRFDA
jgi:hypothetical protein